MNGNLSVLFLHNVALLYQIYKGKKNLCVLQFLSLFKCNCFYAL